jgi:Domain of unknown function (DUF382)
MRNALQEKMADKLKQKGKQRMRPKMGRMDIDYNLMQEAFFKKQHKPSMTPLGDLYYEGAMDVSNFLAVYELHPHPVRLYSHPPCSERLLGTCERLLAVADCGQC